MAEVRVDYASAAQHPSWRKVKTKGKKGVTEQWQVTIRWQEQSGVDGDGEPVFRERRKTKLFKVDDLSPAIEDPFKSRVAKSKLSEWVKSLEESQERVIRYHEEREEMARKRQEEDERRLRETERQEALAAAEAAIPRVYAYAVDFIEQLRKSKSVAIRSLDDYATTAERLRPLEDIPITKLTKEDVQDWLDGLTAKYAPVTVRKSLTLLKRVLDEALEDGLIDRNPAASKRLRKPRNRVSRDKNSITVEDLPKVASLLQSKVQTPYIVAAQIALLTGLREGEIAALKWRDVDFKAKELCVFHAVSRHSHGSEYSTTKRVASDRRLPISEPLMSVFKKRQAAMMEDCLAAGCPTDARHFGELFVIGDVEGHYYEPAQIARNWKVVAEIEGITGQMGQRVLFHDLRHSFSSIALAQKGDLMSVSSSLGHSDPSVTARQYAVADPAAKRKTAALLAEAYTRPVGQLVDIDLTGTDD